MMVTHDSQVDWIRRYLKAGLGRPFLEGLSEGRRLSPRTGHIFWYKALKDHCCFPCPCSHLDNEGIYHVAATADTDIGTGFSQFSMWTEDQWLSGNPLGI